MNIKIGTKRIILSLLLITGVFLAGGNIAQAETVWLSPDNSDNDSVKVTFEGFPLEPETAYWGPDAYTTTANIEVENTTDSEIKVGLGAEKTSGKEMLGEVLTVNVGEKSPHLSKLFTDREELEPVQANDTNNYELDMVFDNSAGNDYQDKQLGFKFLVVVERKGNGDSSENGENGGTVSVPPMFLASPEKEKDEEKEKENEEEEVKGVKEEKEDDEDGKKEEDEDTGEEEDKGKDAGVDPLSEDAGTGITESGSGQEETEKEVKGDKEESEEEEVSEEGVEPEKEAETATGTVNAETDRPGIWWWLLVLIASGGIIWFIYKRRKGGKDAASE